MTEKRFNDAKGYVYDGKKCIGIINDNYTCENIINLLNAFYEENEQLKKGMIEVIDRYIKNIECNPPSSTQTYMKIKRTLNNIREDLRSLIEDFE